MYTQIQAQIDTHSDTYRYTDTGTHMVSLTYNDQALIIGILLD